MYKFVLPPPIALAWSKEAFYDTTGQLIGIRIQIDFADEFEKNLILTHMFYQDISMRTEFDLEVNTGITHYVVDIYGPYEVGDYCLKIYFGGMPIGSCLFSVVADTGRLIVEGVSRYVTTSHTSDEWHYSVSF